jgi:hypothetical protein
VAAAIIRSSVLTGEGSTVSGGETTGGNKSSSGSTGGSPSGGGVAEALQQSFSKPFGSAVEELAVQRGNLNFPSLSDRGAVEQLTLGSAELVNFRRRKTPLVGFLPLRSFYMLV